VPPTSLAATVQPSGMLCHVAVPSDASSAITRIVGGGKSSVVAGGPRLVHSVAPPAAAAAGGDSPT
jgi:hypothetical protein